MSFVNDGIFQTSDVIALAAIFIALCTLVVTIWQGYIAWAHNRRSVRPILTWTRKWVLTARSTLLTFSIVNSGLGPALITRRTFILGDSVFVPQNEGNHVAELIAKILDTQVQHIVRVHSLPATGSAITPGAEFVVAAVEFPDIARDSVEELLDSFVVNFELVYESLYGESRILRA